VGVDDPTRISRRTALQTWMIRTAPLLLLAACGAPATGSPTSAATAKPAGTIPNPGTAAPPTTAPAASPFASPAAVPEPALAASPSPQATAGCVLTPEQTEGPYYIATDLVRSNITEGRPGLPLQLSLAVQRVTSCEPIPGATVEVWHCDALGEYSGFAAAQPQAQGEPPGSRSGAGAAKPGPGGPPPGESPGPGGPGGEQQPVNELRFLRGGQVSDGSGRVTFQTVYPGWYLGRTVHIHVKVHAGGQEVHTGQLYFDDAISNAVYTQQPYAPHTGRDTTNAADSIFAQGGQSSLLTLTQAGSGYTGEQTLVVQV
jgi:protocatechuate 3,4-dioxygenase beta subunit